MADSATSRFKARKQSLGSNVNTWGDDKLNDVLDLFDRGGKGYQAVALTGDVTWTWTNYATSNAGQVAIVKFTGSLSSAVTVTVPSTEWVWLMWNAAGAAVTVKTSAGSGVTLQNGARVTLYCDGTDVVNVGHTVFPTADVTMGGALTIAGKITGLTAGTASGEAVEYDQLNAAIAAGGGSGAADGTVKMDAFATSVYLNSAVLVDSSMAKTDNGDTMTLAVSSQTQSDLEAALTIAMSA